MFENVFNEYKKGELTMETHKKRTTFAGHGYFQMANCEMKNLLIEAIKKEIKDGGLSFTVGTHGDFDKIALEALRTLRKEYQDLEIEVVLTSMHYLVKKYATGDPFETCYTPYDDVKTVYYDIEDVYYKNRIISSNRQMVDDSDILICYVDTERIHSGAKKTYYYAKRKGLKIVNLYKDY